MLNLVYLFLNIVYYTRVKADREFLDPISWSRFSTRPDRSVTRQIIFQDLYK